MSAQPEWRVARLDALTDPSATEFTTGEGDWPFRGILVRRGERIAAFANVCPHQGHPLNLLPDRFFSADGEHLICASHGALFEPETGLCVGGPCVGARLTQVPCRVEDGQVIVEAPASVRDTRR